MPRRKLRGLRALITGASSGIGAALARELAAAGVHLLLVARRADRLRDLAEELTDRGVRVEIFAGDITDAEVRRQALQRATSRFGGLDVLVNNAGVGALGRFDEADPARLRQVMEVNFFAPVELTRAALPMLARGRQPLVVNIGSILGYRGIPYYTEYCASKFALRGFSEALRTELARDGIGLLLVSPGRTQTEFFENVIEETREMPWSELGGLPPERVARDIAAAIRRGRAEIVPSRSGRMMVRLSRFSPRLMDWFLKRYSREEPERNGEKEHGASEHDKHAERKA